MRLYEELKLRIQKGRERGITKNKLKQIQLFGKPTETYSPVSSLKPLILQTESPIKLME
jgi:hypothetical protein